MSNTTQRYAVTIVAHYIVETDNRDALTRYTLPELDDTGASFIQYDGGTITSEPLTLSAVTA